MRKRLLSLLSLVTAFVLCFALVACGGGDKKPSGGGEKKPAGGGGDKGTAVSVSLNELLDSVGGVLSADGFKGSASYSLSTQKTDNVTESYALDKRGSKLKVGDTILDFDTGYTYFSGEDGYTFYQYPFGGALDRVRGMFALVGDDVMDAKLPATYYEADGKTVLTVDVAENVNKYVEPFYNAYKLNKSLNALLNDYCNLLFGTSFDEIYSDISDFIKDENNTVGTLADVFGAVMGVDVFELLIENGLPLDNDMVTTIKERSLSKVFMGGYNYLIGMITSMMPGFGISTVDELEGDSEEGDGMTALLMGAMQAMFFDEVDTSGIDSALLGIKTTLAFGTRTLVDLMLVGDEGLADIYNAIKNEAKFDELAVTVTLTEKDKALTDLKIDCFASHTYTGTASAGSLLADNDYLASVELKIDEYTTSPADFVITFDPEFDYRHNVTVYVYELSDTDFHVYYETAGNEMMCESIVLYDNDFELIGNVGSMNQAYSNTVSFSDSDSSFVFSSAFLKSYFDGASVGTELNVVVYYDTNDYFTVTLVYMDGEPTEILDYVFDSIGGMLGGMGGGDIGADEYVTQD